MENILLSSMLAQRGKAGGPVPVGGTEGQVIVKDSSTDFDVSWKDTDELSAVTDLKSAIGDNVVYYRWTQGGINTSGEETDNTAAIRTSDYFVPDENLYIVCADGYRYRIHRYNSSKVWQSVSSWQYGSQAQTIDADYYRLILVKNPSATIVPSEGSNLLGRTGTYNSDVDENRQRIVSLETQATTAETDISALKILHNQWEVSGVQEGYLLTTTGEASADADYNTSGWIPVVAGDIIYGNRQARYAFYDSEKAFLSTGRLFDKTEIVSGWYKVTVPESAEYFRICVATASNASPIITFASKYEQYLESMIPSSSNTHKLYCLGDSITKGMYTIIGDTSSRGPTTLNYPYWIGIYNNYNIENLGRSGAGWLLQSTDTTENAMDVVDANDFSDADFITLAFGVNDYKASTPETLGDISTSTSQDGTVIGSMMYCIETLATSYPSANIIVLLPMNENRFSSGTLATNWAFGYAYNDGKTLTDYRTAIKACADYYNVKTIDLEEVCAINRINIRTCLGDGLHPTLAFYKQMGHTLASVIK